MSELWTAEQREWLHAMGHAVWSVASPEARAAESRPEEPLADSPRGGGAMREAAALLAREERPASRSAPRTADRLMQALMRAAAGVDEATLARMVGDVSALRGNAAAKRALWPRLRALRRTTQA
ncbi:hypothetical protein JI752_005640 [Lysobacter sp. MMG2]|uniref:hypothetical protein n=1 Tax=Lysobacter sp. MMG2 TaxID=2801338 RepID=UPI001C22284B|nr:hypothetical protein [Lysobacter sp. MMG2]MBU8975618.1 hypothetical protein [Lysobacter sp. MMG2]